MATKPMGKRGPYPEALARVGHYKCRTQSKFIERRLTSDLMISQVRAKNKEIQVNNLKAKLRRQNGEDQNMDEDMDDNATSAVTDAEDKQLELEHIKNLELEMNQMEDENLRLQSLVEKLKEDRGDLASEEDSRDEVIETLENENEELKKQLAENNVGPSFTELQRQIAELKMAKKKLRADWKEADEMSRDSQVAVDDHRDQIKSYLAQIAKYQQMEKDRKDPDLRQQVANLEQKLVDANDQISNLEMWYHRGDEKVVFMEKLVQTRNGERKKLERDLEQVTKHLSKELETITISLGQSANAVANHENTISHQQNVINQLNVELQTMQELVAQHVQNTANISAQRDEAAVGGKALFDQLQDSQNEIARLQGIEQQYQSAAANLESLNVMVDKLYADRGDRNSLLISDLLSEGRAAIDLLKDIKKEVSVDDKEKQKPEHYEDGTLNRMFPVRIPRPRGIAMDKVFGLISPYGRVQVDEMDVDVPMDGTVQTTTPAGIQGTTTAFAHSSTQTIAQAPAAKAPQVKAPAAKAPAAKAPEVKPPATKAPVAKAPEVKTPAAKAPEVKAPAAKAPEVKASEVKAPTAKAPVAKAPEVKTPAAKAPEVKASEVKAPTAKAPEVKASDGKPPVAKASDVKAPDVQAPDGKTPAAKAPEVKAPVVKAPVVKTPDGKAPVISSTADETPTVISKSTYVDSSVQTSTQTPAVKESPATESVTVEGSAGNPQPTHADSSAQATIQAQGDKPTAAEPTPVEAPTVELKFKVPEKPAPTAPPAAPKTSATEPTANVADSSTQATTLPAAPKASTVESTAKTADETTQGTTQTPAMKPTGQGSSSLSADAEEAIAKMRAMMAKNAAAKEAAAKDAAAKEAAAKDAAAKGAAMKPKTAYAESSAQTTAQTPAAQFAPVEVPVVKPRSFYADSSTQTAAPTLDVAPTAAKGAAAAKPMSAYTDSSTQVGPVDLKPSSLLAPAVIQGASGKLNPKYVDSSTQMVAGKPEPARAAPVVAKDVPAKPKSTYASSSTQTVDKPKPSYASSSTQTVIKPKPSYASSSTQTDDKPKPSYTDSSTQTVDKPKPVYVDSSTQTPKVAYKDASTQTPIKANGLPLWTSGPMLVEEPGLGPRMPQTIHPGYYRNLRLEAHLRPFNVPTARMTPLLDDQPTLRMEPPKPKVEQPKIETEVKPDVASATTTTAPVASVPAVATEPHVCPAPTTIHHYHRISKRKLSTSELWAMVPLWASLLIILFFLLFTYFSFTTFAERWMWLRANESARRFVVAWRERGYGGSRGLGVGIGLDWAGADARWMVGVPGGWWEGAMFEVEQWIGMKRGYYM